MRILVFALIAKNTWIGLVDKHRVKNTWLFYLFYWLWDQLLPFRIPFLFRWLEQGTSLLYFILKLLLVYSFRLLKSQKWLLYFEDIPRYCSFLAELTLAILWLLHRLNIFHDVRSLFEISQSFKPLIGESCDGTKARFLLGW